MHINLIWDKRPKYLGPVEYFLDILKIEIYISLLIEKKSCLTRWIKLTLLKMITQRLSSLKIVSSEILSYTAVGYWCQWDSNPSTLIILLESIHMQENGLSGSLNIPTGHNGAKNLLKNFTIWRVFSLIFQYRIVGRFQ